MKKIIIGTLFSATLISSVGTAEAASPGWTEFLKLKTGDSAASVKSKLKIKTLGKADTVYDGTYSDLASYTIQASGESQIDLMFTRKSSKYAYRLAGLSYIDPFAVSKSRLISGKKIKNGYSEKALDSVLTGNGLGAKTSYFEFSDDLNQTKVIGRTKSYRFLDSASEYEYAVDLEYDFKKKAYVVESVFKSTYFGF